MFDSAVLTVFAQDGDFTLWEYRSDDAAAEIEAVGYFDAAAGTVRQGDMILSIVDPKRGGSQLFHVALIDEDGVDVEVMTRGGIVLPAPFVAEAASA